jgi:uncharacterized protein (TIGR00290 family)
MSKGIVSWSGGKDSCFAMYEASRKGIKPTILLNVLNEEGKISRSHGIPETVLQAQADTMSLPIHLISASWQDYEVKFTQALSTLQQRNNLSHAVFGDIDLDAHKDWEEKVCKQAGITAILPLWKRNRKELVLAMLEWGLKTIIVSCQDAMGPNFLGKTLSLELIQELEEMGIDPCGENGEFHTLVLDCPLFHSPLDVQLGEKVLHNNYWFTTMELSQ